MKSLVLFLFLLVSLISCTDNTMVKKYGGKATMELKPNEKLINVTWKEAELWILTRPMTEKDSAQTYTFREKSSMGIIQGEFTIKEVKE